KPISAILATQVATKYQLQKPYVLCVGTIEARKNQLRLVQAFAEANLPEAELILIGGKTPFQTEIENYVQQKGLQKRVRIFNKVPFEHLPALYQQARIFAYPSIFEGFGIPIVEALQVGVPVLAATGSCLEEAGGTGALYANPLDVSELTSKLSQLWQDDTLRANLCQNGQQHVQQFNAQRIANQLVTIYQSLITSY
ncbi:MAG: glycosyltransferase family 1 protein, partial [Runella slithyformis]